MDLNTSVKLPKKQFYTLIAALGVILFALSAEVMIRVKDILLFEQWYDEALGSGLTAGYEELFDVYLSLNLSDFFFKAIVPMLMGIYSYFAYVKIRINKLFVFIWTVLLVGAAAYIAVGRNFSSVFYYIILALYIVAVFTVLSLIKVIDDSKYT